MTIIWFVIILFMFKLLATTLHHSKQKQYRNISLVLIGLITNVIIWLLCEIATQLFLTDKAILFFYELKFIAILSIPGLLYAFSYELYYRKKISLIYNIRNIGLPIIFMFFIATNYKHHLFRSSVFVEYGYVNIVHIENNIIFYLALIFIYSTLVSTLLLLGKYLLEQPRIYRTQLKWAFLGILFGMLTNLVYQVLQIFTNWQFDFTTLSFGIIVWVFYGVFYEYNPKFIKHIIEKSIPDQEQSGVAFLSREFGFLYVNTLMCNMFNMKEDKMLQLTINDLSSKFRTAILESIEDKSEKLILCTLHNRLKHYEISSQAVQDQKMRLIGYIIIVKDTTNSYVEIVQERIEEKYSLSSN